MLSLSSSRLAYVDWLRGLACLLMFQTHCYDAWLNGQARRSTFFKWSQLLGTLPAPLFLLLAGISVALAVNKLQQKGSTPAQVGRITIYRGAQILALGLLFRLQEYLIAWGWAPGSDLLRVDILNTIGISMMLLGLTCWLGLHFRGKADGRVSMAVVASAISLTISLLTPALWTTWAPGWLPWPLESYINGVHNLGQPQAWLFPIFPWAGFAFVGLAVGSFLETGWAKRIGAKTFVLLTAGGILLLVIARGVDSSSRQFYAAPDYWHTSPTFFLARVGLLLLVLAGGYGWCRTRLGQSGFSPLVQLGHTSLLVYWIHLEFVYGRLSILPKKATDIETASMGLLAIFLFMLLLSALRTRWRDRKAEARQPDRRNLGFKAPTIAG